MAPKKPLLIKAVERIGDGPIITPELHPSLGDNIQGPSLIRAPDWFERPLGRYYLYFADHKGNYIRLAFADALAGPWRVQPGGSLTLAQSGFLTTPPAPQAETRARIQAAYEAAGVELSHALEVDLATPHIASPEVLVDDAARRIVMYYHGLHAYGVQLSRVATSDDGLNFAVQGDVLGNSYMRAFDYAGYRYLLAMPGVLYRSKDPLQNFAKGPTLFNPRMRHAAVQLTGDTLAVYWTQVGDAPERILRSLIDLRPDWHAWQATEPEEVLRPETPWEGVDAPLEPSKRSVAYGAVNQLRDPAIFEEDGETYLLYSIAGESGIAIARIIFA